jgi:hypothetical protein
VQQHHAPLAEPDGAAPGLETQQAAQVGVGRVMQGRFHGVSWCSGQQHQDSRYFEGQTPFGQARTCTGMFSPIDQTVAQDLADFVTFFRWAGRFG